jgi:hypothetical protein
MTCDCCVFKFLRRSVDGALECSKPVSELPFLAASAGSMSGWNYYVHCVSLIIAFRQYICTFCKFVFFVVSQFKPLLV